MERIFRWKRDGDIGVVTFGAEGEAMNTWSDQAFADFNEVVDGLDREPGLTGAIIISGKPDNFLAGANLRQLSQLTDRKEAGRVIGQFHDSFDRLASLKIPTVAAVHGYCLGGGLEFALAATAIIAREAPTTLIGLPECNVGLFPGGGGTQRLPRRIGYKAIDLILKADMLPARKALELGIIDRLVGAEADLLAAAGAFLKEIVSGTAQLKRPSFDFSDVDQAIEKARQGVLAAGRGRLLPGPKGAIDSIREGLKVGLAQGLAIERENFITAVLTNEAKGSINSFFLKSQSDKPKAMITKGFTPRPPGKIAVLGLGTMGRGIIVDILRNTDLSVLAVDLPEALSSGKEGIAKILADLDQKKQLKQPVALLLARLEVTPEYEKCAPCDLVIEAVFENLELKENIYRLLSGIVSPEAILASNTSSLSINRMAAYVKNPERFAGLHFFSPVWRMQLVEIVRGEGTSRDTLDNLLAFAAQLRKRPLVCKDYPGFVVNALLFPYFVAALEYVEAGTPIEEVDGAMLDFGMPVGPIRLIDNVGIDVPYKVLQGWGREQRTLKQVVGSGRLGLKKSGQGFFLADGRVDPGVLPLIERKEGGKVAGEEIAVRLHAEMVKAGKALLDQGIVDDARQIDIGMIWGAGFPADKGGPMKWADLTGLSGSLFGGDFYRG